MISRSFKTTALVAAILGTIGAAHATSLLPGTGPVAIDTADLPAGTFLAYATGTVNGGGFTGTARTAVYRETATNFLDVIYQFTDLSGSSIVSISGLTLIISLPTCSRAQPWQIRAYSYPVQSARMSHSGQLMAMSWNSSLRRPVPHHSCCRGLPALLCRFAQTPPTSRVVSWAYSVAVPAVR